MPENCTLSGNSTFTGGLTLTDAAPTPTEFTWLVTVSGTNQTLGNGPVTLSPGTTLSINAASNIGSGNTIDLVSQSALAVTSDSFDPALVIAPASTQATLELGATTYTRTLNMANYGDGTLTLSASTGLTINYNASTLQPGAGNVYRLGGGPGTLVISGYDNVLTGTASVLASGGVNLMNANNFTGGFSGSAGIGNDGALGSGPVTLGGLTALNGTRTLNNPVFFTPVGYTGLTGPITFNGTVNLGGGTATVFVNGSPVVFANVISNGSLQLNSGTAILQANNTFSALELYGGKATIASSNNLGGSTTPLVFGGTSGTLETTSDITLSNPIRFSLYSAYQTANFQVDSATTLTLNQAISGSSLTVNKTGTGNLVFSTNSSSGGLLYLYGGNTFSAGNSLSNTAVQINPGATFSGSGNLYFLIMGGGQVAPGSGTGTISAPNYSISGANSFLFQFTQFGSPNYANLSNSGNGLLTIGTIGSSPFNFYGSTVSIFLSTPTVQAGSLYKGAFFLQSTSLISSTLFSGVNFAFYVPSPTGTTTFNGQTFAPLNSSQYAVQQSWVAENGGQVCQFVIVGSIGSPPTLASLNTPFYFAFPANNNATFSVTSGTLPSGMTLSSAGILSGTPTLAGAYSFAITSNDGAGNNTIQNFSLTVQAPVASTDTPTMPQWALIVLTALVTASAIRSLSAKPLSRSD